MSSSYKSFFKTFFFIFKALLLYGDNFLDLLQFHHSPIDLLGLLCIPPTGNHLLDVTSSCSMDDGVRLWEERKETYVITRNNVVKPGAGRHQKGRKKLERYLSGKIMASKKRLLTFHPQTQIKQKWYQKKKESVQRQYTYILRYVIRGSTINFSKLTRLHLVLFRVRVFII
jgi:hypothetical protein